MLVPILLLLGGLVVLTIGAEFLVRGASRLALRFGMSALVVGLTVVAFGTSAPELAVSVGASLRGSGAIAVGNVIGSNIFNVACILGLAALICPLKVHSQVVRREMPVMLVASIFFVVFLMSGGVSRIEGLLLFAGVIAYTVLSIRASRMETLAALEQEEHPPASPVWLLAGLILAGLALLLFGSSLMVENAIVLAKHWGISDAVVGLTIVAAGTSLPELATSVVASFRKETDIAVGNIVGSNIFNVLCIGGAAGTIAPPLTGAGVTATDFAFMIGTSVLVLPLMITGFAIKRWEGAVLLASYLLYLFFIWPT